MESDVVRERSTCHYCRLPFGASNVGGPSRDHVVPVAVGGTGNRTLKNIVKACRPCNNAKGAALLLGHCEFCNAAHDAFVRWLTRLEQHDHITALNLRYRYEQADRLTLADVVGAPRALVLELVDRQRTG